MTNQPLHQIDEEPMILAEPVREILADLAMKATNFAAENYVVLDNGQKIPKAFADGQWDSLQDVFDPNAVGRVNCALMALFRYAYTNVSNDRFKALQEIGNDLNDAISAADYKFVVAGNHALTFLRRDKNNGSVSLLRVGSNIIQDVHSEKENIWSHSPLLTASFNNVVIKDVWSVAETEPLALMTFNSSEADAYYAFQEVLFYGTCFKPSKINEIGVRADGTLMIFDPGEAICQDSFYSFGEQAQNDWVKNSLSIIRARLAVMDVPNQFNPYADDGELKQQKARDDMRLVA